MTLQGSPYLRNQRDFPDDNAKLLAVQVDKAYIEIANAVNSRIIGTFAPNFSIVTGESWYLKGGSQKQQTLRQVYPFSVAGSIAHGITVSSISGFTAIYGTVSDTSGNWYPLPYVDSTSAANQISLQITATNIVITQGAGAPFTIASGFVVLEWLSAS
jgi:hypothetical protein